jgi:hypothetical protein
MENKQFELTKEDNEVFTRAKEITESVARERGSIFTKSLYKCWKKFYNQPPFHGRSLVINYASLAQAAVAFWEDILRFKSYHTIVYSDEHKRAAHIFKWISRMRPIKILVDSCSISEIEEPYLRANAFFALACAMSFLKCDDFSQEETKYIIYASMFRDIHAREWSMIFYLLEKQHPSNCN